jgi:hypothetical protein
MFKLFSYNAKDLLGNVADLTVSRSSTCSSNLILFDKESSIADFSTKSSESTNTWQQRVYLVSLKDLPEEELEKINNFDDVKNNPAILQGDIKVACNCPSFVFWGNAYDVDSAGSGDGSLSRYQDSPFPEGRAPTKNIHLRGFLCKHLISVLRNFLI